jgi:hypothetical protein
MSVGRIGEICRPKNTVWKRSSSESQGTFPLSWFMTSSPSSPAMLRLGSASSRKSLFNNPVQEKPIFYAAVLDYYSLDDKSFYENHFFILQVFIEQYEYKIERSYSSFCELDLKLHHQYPKTKLPTLPLEGLKVYKKKYQKRFPLLSSLTKSKPKKEIQYNSLTQHKIMAIITKTAEVNRLSVIDRKMQALNSLAKNDDDYEEDYEQGRGRKSGKSNKDGDQRDSEEIMGSFHSKASIRKSLRKPTDPQAPATSSSSSNNRPPVPFYYTKRSESSLSSENLLQKKLPLTIYLQELLSIQEVALSDLLLQFFDEEIPDYFLLAASSSASYSPAIPLFSENEKSLFFAASSFLSSDKGTGEDANSNTIIPIASYFQLNQEILDNLEIYLLFLGQFQQSQQQQKQQPQNNSFSSSSLTPSSSAPTGLQSKTLKTEEFQVSLPITNNQKIFYLFFTDYYDVALSITFQPTKESEENQNEDEERKSLFLLKKNQQGWQELEPEENEDEEQDDEEETESDDEKEKEIQISSCNPRPSLGPLGEDLWKVMENSTDFQLSTDQYQQNRRDLLSAVVTPPGVLPNSSSSSHPVASSSSSSANQPGGGPSKPKKEYTLVNYQRYPSHEKVIHGALDISSFPNVLEGIITFKFDNSYSKWRSKTLNYFIKSFENELVQGITLKTMEIQNFKNDFQQKRIFLKQTFASLSNYLTLTNQNIINPYTERKKAAEKKQKEEKESEETEEHTVEEDEEDELLEDEDEDDHDDNRIIITGSQDSEDRVIPDDDDEKEGGATPDEGELLSEDSASRKSLKLKLPENNTSSKNRSSKSTKRNKEEENKLMKQLFPADNNMRNSVIQDDSNDESMDLDELLALQRASDVGMVGNVYNNGAAQRELLLQQFSQKEMISQMKKISKENKSLQQQLQIKEKQLQLKEQEITAWIETEQEKQQTITSLSEELKETREERRQAQSDYQQLLNQRQDHHLQHHFQSVEELLAFDPSTSPVDDKEKNGEIAMENFQSLLQFTKKLKKSFDELQSSQQLLLEQVVPKLKTEKKQLKALGNSLKEKCDSLERDLQLQSHEMELLAQENLLLKDQITRQGVSSIVSRPKTMTVTAEPPLKPISSKSDSFSDVPLSDHNSEQRLTNPPVVPAPPPPMVVPEMITISKEQLQNIVIQVQETTSKDEEEEDETSAGTRSNNRSKTTVEEEEDDQNNRRNSSGEGYHYLDNYGSNRKLVKIDFTETEPDEISSAIHAMRESFLDWFNK